MLLECRTCPARGDACRDCMVSALVDGPSVALDPRESAVVAEFVGAGLLGRDQARGLRARLEPARALPLTPVAASRAG
ncbi:hypothetical protein [Arsenicicoccus sp. oral taxon 190]|uniref:hypothetical protein n=1 Tax=Arsenicicoccus sp. oral taxon 190 TaxID=1658671 RepID=UPI00067A1120|nr:hypothetical protein [Arsenicicoccus sp. oral taxon 190]AKT52050.1 hypothetical protein ADJ73_13585 [Arsenicicoccus sp. oral taxon 190]